MQLLIEPVVSKEKTISSGGGPTIAGGGDVTFSGVLVTSSVSITLSAAEFSRESGAIFKLELFIKLCSVSL